MINDSMRQHIMGAIERAFAADEALQAYGEQHRQAPACTDLDLGAWLGLGSATTIGTLAVMTDEELRVYVERSSYLIARIAEWLLDFKGDRNAEITRLALHEQECKHCATYKRVRDRQLAILKYLPGVIGPYITC